MIRTLITTLRQARIDAELQEIISDGNRTRESAELIRNFLLKVLQEDIDGKEKFNDEIRAEAYGSSDNPALSSAFDFPLRYGLVQALAVEESGKGGQGASVLDASWNKVENYPDHAMPNLMLGNHDLVRFGDLLERGNFNPADYWQRHKAAFSFLAARSGPITLYYGEEFGDEVPGFAKQVGGDCAAQGLCDDHVARSDGKVPGATGFTPSGEQAELKQWLSQLLALRAKHPALYQGERVKLQSRLLIDGAAPGAGYYLTDLGMTVKLQQFNDASQSSDPVFEETLGRYMDDGKGVDEVPGDGILTAEAVLDRTRMTYLLGDIEHPFSQGRWRADLRFSLGLNDRDNYVNPRLTYTGIDQHELFVAAHLFGGASNTLGGFYRRNDAVSVGWQAKF